MTFAKAAGTSAREPTGEELNGLWAGGDVTMDFHKGKHGLFCGETDDIILSDGGHSILSSF